MSGRTFETAGSAAGDLVMPIATSRRASVDLAMARAALLFEDGESSRAADVVAEAFGHPEIWGEGWVLPVEPLLNVSSAPDVFSVPLARLAARAM